MEEDSYATTLSSQEVGDEPESRYYPETYALYWIDKIFFSITLVILGILGNILSFGMLWRVRFRATSAAYYMRALALSDTGVLLALFGNHTMRLYGVPLTNSIYCKLVYFITKWCMACSDWILAIMCMERSIAIAFPLKSKKFLKPTVNKIALAFVCICLGAYFSHTFVIYGSENGLCRQKSLAFDPNIRGLVDYSFVIIAAVIIITSNIVIVTCLLKSAKTKAKLVGGESDVSAQTSLVTMLIAISVAFFVMKSPYFISKIVLDKSSGRRLQYDFTNAADAQARLALGIALNLLYGNNAVNFYLYVVSGREYRNELKKMIMGCFKRETLSSSMGKTSSTSLSAGK